MKSHGRSVFDPMTGNRTVLVRGAPYLCPMARVGYNDAPNVNAFMYTVTRSISFCYGHRLLAYDGPCMHLHGHNARAVITLEAADLDHRGMVVDFIDIKQAVKEWIDSELDHTMLLHEDDPFLQVMQAHNERVRAVPFNPTAENIARMIFERVQELGLPVIEVTLWETETSQATFRPHS